MNSDNNNSIVKIENNKGSKCSINGKIYELKIFNIVRFCVLNGKKFNTQNENELGGCSNKNDIECNMNNLKDVPIEIKKSNSPDWMQCSLKYDNINKKWIGGHKNKIPESSKEIFDNLLQNNILFNGKIPHFITNNITHKEWIEIKRNTNDFNDCYIECPNDTIKKLYCNKGCSYIQISNKGLYHLGNDVCGFKVPEFICDQHLRIRTKIHKKQNTDGFCVLSITISCKPKCIKNLVKSEYSLDDERKLPTNLLFIKS